MPETAHELKLPALLAIMDGYGIAPASPTNAISLANTPTLDRLSSAYPHRTISASCEAVGLPDGQMGNSEVGHLNIGAGRVIFQELTRISNACKDGSIESNEVLGRAFDAAIENEGTIHFMGLLSNGGVHSSNDHLYALLNMAAKRGARRIYVHCFMDGRDVPPSSGKGFIEELERQISSIAPSGCDMRIASISGRYYAMDRDNRWERVAKAYDALVGCKPQSELKPADFMQASYDAGITDEFVVPASFTDQGIESKDSVVFFNFRPDRARQITRAFTERTFNEFERCDAVFPHFVCLTEYDPQIEADVAFPKEFPENVLADILAANGLKQFHIAETEKYAHVTFFLNGGLEQEKSGEERCLIPSPQVATYDLKPEMSAREVTDALCEAISNDRADVYIVNFANCDMVGHTGCIPEAVSAVEVVDECLGRVLEALKDKNGVALVTADHGNADCMADAKGNPHTAHTTNPVPLYCVDYTGDEHEFVEGEGALCNIAPTLLDLIGIDAPAEMTAPSLIGENDNKSGKCVV